MADISLEFLARQNERILADLRVLTAMVLRLDSTMQGVTQELHEIYHWMTRVDNRVSKLEEVKSL